jgi:hypothetical protein
MSELMQELVEGIRKWREQDVEDYWLRVSYLGGELNRFGDHEMTYKGGTLYHLWHGKWREIKQGSDFWLFSVPGGFAWARDLLTKVAPKTEVGEDALDIVIDDDYGFVKRLDFQVGHRDPENFTFEVTRFGTGVHPSFEAPSE